MLLHREDSHHSPKMAGDIERLFEDSLNGAPFGMAITDLEGGWIKLNTALCKMAGFEKDELLKRDLHTILYPQNDDKYQEILSQLRETKSSAHEMEASFMRPDGSELWAWVTIGLLCDEDGEPLYFMVQMLDITISKQSEQHMAQMQKMEAVGQLAGGIAHDFNNLLTIVFGNTKILQNFLEKDSWDKEEALKRLDTIHRAASRGADLVKQMMIFSRQRTLEPITTDINELISDTRELLQRSLSEQISVQLELASDLWPVDIDPGQLEHAIINMAVNARDAMPDGGTLTIRTKNIVLDQEKSKERTVAPGAYVKIEITDTGTGMSEEVKSRIFDPFYTTKAVGKGTGLGLSTVYGFIRDSDGYIRVDSKTGAGTSFKIYLPRGKEEHSEKIKENTVPIDSQSLKGQETILLVEDEPEIREITAHVLKEHNYNIIEAVNGDDALEKLVQHGDKIDLMFTDILMPGDMNGVQMAARAMALYPNLKVIFATGFAEGNVPDMNLIEKFPVMDKPYIHSDLIQQVRTVLDTNINDPKPPLK